MTPTTGRTVLLWLLATPPLLAWAFLPWSGGPFGVKNALGLVASAVLALSLWLRRPAAATRLPAGPMAAALALVAASSVLSCLAALDGDAAAWGALRNLSFLSLFVCALNFDDPREARRAFEQGLIVAAAGVALFGVKQVLFPGVLDPGFKALGKMRVYSTLGNPNLAAVFLLAALPVTAQRLKDAAALPAKVALAAALALQAACLLMTRCRDAVLALAVMGLAALLWRSSRRTRGSVLAGLGLLAAGVVAAQLLGGRFSALHALKGRLFIWATSARMILDNPLLGVGPGQFGLHHMEHQSALFASGQFGAFADNAAVLFDAHNDFLDLGATTGVFGMLGLLGACGLLLWKGARSPAVRAELPAPYLAIAGVMVAMLFNGTLFYAPTAFNFWLMAGFLWREAAGPAAEWRPGVWARRAGGVLLTGLLAAFAWHGARQARAGLLEGRGDELMAQRDSWSGLKAYREAARWAPRDGRILLKYATACYLENRYGEALRALERARRWSSEVGALYLEAEILTRMERDPEAIALYERIIAAFPNHVSPHFILGQIHRRRGDEAKARQAFDAVLRLQPSGQNVNLTKGKVLLQKKLVAEYLDAARAPAP